MAWGYWSATSVSDRGRSPRRDKDKHSAAAAAAAAVLQQHHHQPAAVASTIVHVQPQQTQQQQVYQQPSQLTEQPVIVVQQEPLPSSHQQQQQQPAQVVSTAGISLSSNEPLAGGSSLHMQQMQAELAAAVAENLPPQDPCSRMIQGGSFYSYSAVANAERRRGQDNLGGPIGVQVLPRGVPATAAAATTSSATYHHQPPSPVESDSVDYEQPATSGMALGMTVTPGFPTGSSSQTLPRHVHIIDCDDDDDDEGLITPPPPPPHLMHTGHLHAGHHRCEGSSLVHTSSRMKLLRDDDDIIEGLSDVEFEDSADVIYSSTTSTTRIGQPGTSGCLIHGIPPPCRIPPEPAPPLPPPLGGGGGGGRNEEQREPGEPQLWFDDITWGRSASSCWDDLDDGEYLASHDRSCVSYVDT